ncbi:MAG: histidine phosphatase family protein [Anaerolineae bacterium]
MTGLILVRHGETEMSGRYLGHTDPPLSTRGRAQAAVLAERLAGEPLVAVYSSHLRRALMTAQLIAAPHRLEVGVTTDLAELDFGDWDSLTYQEIARNDSEWLARWLANPLAVRPPGGETLAEMSERVMGAIKSIVAEHAEETVAIVTHGGPARATVCHALGIPLSAQWRVCQDLAAISRLEFKARRATLVSLNDICHLLYLDTDHGAS